MRGLVAPETMAQVRDAILDFVNNPGEHSNVLSEELAAKQGEQREGAARYRKLEQLGRFSPLIWNAYMLIRESLRLCTSSSATTFW